MRHTRAPQLRSLSAAGFCARAACLALVLLAALAGCGAVIEPDALADTSWPDLDPARYERVVRFAQITDAHALDEESPGRTAVLGGLIGVAWRPHERYSLQLIDGMVRAVNAYHVRVAPLDFLLHTGDAVDNAQLNELHWFLDCLDGRTLDPLSGIDDRDPADRGPPALDPHVPFRAEGLYRQGVHGPAASLPWYAVMGNHDRYAVGTLPLVGRLDGGLMAPLPGAARFGIFLPVVLVPDGPLAYGTITPAHPCPLPGLLITSLVSPNPARRFVTANEYVAAHFDTLTGPAGHGFGADGRTWYAVQPVPGLRLIVLDTTLAAVTVPGGDYHSGGVTGPQVDFLLAELAAADAADELVVIATHHPSADLSVQLGTQLLPEAFREVLRAQPNVVAHLAGHEHCHRVTDREGYLEFETGAVIDPPHQGRIIEIWREKADSPAPAPAPGAGERAVILRYATFAQDYTGTAFAGLPETPTDPLLEMRRAAQTIAENQIPGIFDPALSRCGLITAQSNVQP